MSVKLKSYFNIHPFIIYCIKIFFIFFLIGMLPSFFTSSRRVYIDTNLYPLQVSIDGKYSGITPFNEKLKAGEHSIIIRYADIELYKGSFVVKNALFYSWFFEYSQHFSYRIDERDEYISAVNRNILKDSVAYSTMYYVDKTTVQKPFFSHYKTLLSPKNIDENVLRLSKKMIANPYLAEDFRKNFEKDYEFFEFPEYVYDTKKSSKKFKSAEYQTIENIDFVVIDDTLAITKKIYEHNKDYNEINKALEAFSKKTSLPARLITIDEYKGIFESNLEDYFYDLKTGLYEQTGTIFTPSGDFIDIEDEKLLEQYCVKPNYRLFALSSYNSEIDDKIRMAIVAPAFYDKRYSTAGYRILLELNDGLQ